MNRTIKLSFQDHTIEAKNSNPTSDIVTLVLDFYLVDFGEKLGAVTLVGTQNAINAVSDQNPIEIKEIDGVENHATVNGNIEVTTQFEEVDNLYATYCIAATLIDHIGWQSFTKVNRQTNFILTHNHEPIVTEEGDALVFVQPNI